MYKEIDIEYIYHSCFVVNFENMSMVFDYYKGDLSSFRPGGFVFFSHNHEDHYNPEIFERDDAITYFTIMSNDILDYERKGKLIEIEDRDKWKDLKRPLPYTRIMMNEYDWMAMDDIRVQTFGSTDRGSCFHVKYDGINIFHAGDLNLWIWDEDTPEERAQMEEDFMEIVDKVSQLPVDIAFFPLDPRLGDRYADGFNIFLEKLKPSMIFPMHFGDDISYNLRYISDFPEYSQVFRPIFNKNQNFKVNY